MRRILLAATAVLMAGPAFAVSHYNSQRMTCASARQRVQEEGAVSFRYRSATNPSLTLWDLYVMDDRFCEPDTEARQAYLPTKDTDRCVMLVCKPAPRDAPMFMH